MKQDMLLTSMAKAIQRFERYSFNILNPFTNMNMVTEKLSSRRVALLTKVFSMGFSTMTTLLQQCIVNPSSMRDVTRLYFPTVLSRFLNPWRPDAMNNTIQNDPIW
jgi:hypothetical protein